MRNDVEEKLGGGNSQENEKKKRKKKRGRTEEDSEGIHYNNNNNNNSKNKKKKKNYLNSQSADKLDTTEHCNTKAKTEDSNKDHVHVQVQVHDSDNINCSTISSENPVASSGLGVFEFPWTREGIVSKSEYWDCVEDTFSSSLEDTCFRSRPFKFSDYYCFLSDTNTPAPAATLMHFDDDIKHLFNESDDDHGRTTTTTTTTETDGESGLHLEVVARSTSSTGLAEEAN